MPSMTTLALAPTAVRLPPKSAPKASRDVNRRRFGGQLVAAAQRVQVTAHPGLVGDDRGVLGVGLAIAAVAARGVVHRAARDVEQLLIVG